MIECTFSVRHGVEIQLREMLQRTNGLGEANLKSNIAFHRVLRLELKLFQLGSTASDQAEESNGLFSVNGKNDMAKGR